jgi:hypothetical protein
MITRLAWSSAYLFELIYWPVPPKVDLCENSSTSILAPTKIRASVVADPPATSHVSASTEVEDGEDHNEASSVSEDSNLSPRFGIRQRCR